MCCCIYWASNRAGNAILGCGAFSFRSVRFSGKEKQQAMQEGEQWANKQKNLNRYHNFSRGRQSLKMKSGKVNIGKNVISPNQSSSLQKFDELIRSYNTGCLSLAEKQAKKLTEILPNHPVAWKVLGTIFTQQGRLSESIETLRRAVGLVPDDHEAHIGLANVLRYLGKLSEAEASYREAIRLKPDAVEAYGNLGVTLQGLGRLDEAEQSYRELIRLKPDCAEAHNNLGTVLRKLGYVRGAEASYREAIRLKPDYSHAHNNLANTLRDFGRFIEAELSCREAINLKPDFSEAHNNLGAVLYELGHLSEAEVSFRKAIQLTPNISEIHNNLGNVLKDLCRFGEAEASYRESLSLKPDNAEAHSNLGLTLRYLGRLADAELSIRKAIEISPTNATYYSGLLMTLLYMEKSSEEVWNASQGFGRAFDLHPRINWPRKKNSTNPSRRIRVGYVSGDFRNHSVAYFIKNIFALHDRNKFAIYAYSTCAQEDSITASFKKMSDHWRKCSHITDEFFVNQILRDRIDLLVDLSGHTAHNRLTVFTYKPAPIQITWVGYPGTTGLKAMDYRITYESIDPKGTSDEYNSEKLIRLPDHTISFEPLGSTPNVNELPALSNSFFTFGCCNIHSKITISTIDLWVKILRIIPHSRFILANANDASEPQKYFIKEISKFGLNIDRLILKPRLSLDDYWSLHHEIDLQLDTFPYNGGTTSLQSLWMGVPVLTLAGTMAQSRVGMAVLKRVGLNSFIAKTSEEYILIAKFWSKNLNKLNRIRKSLRGILSSSDEKSDSLTSYLEAAYQQIWIDYCQNNYPQ
jgi:protein O-GlcNAc transferase